MLLKPHLDGKYHQLCTRNEPVGDNLFGDDISKRVKDISDAKKIRGAVFPQSAVPKNLNGYTNRGQPRGRGYINPRYSRGYRGRQGQGSFRGKPSARRPMRRY